MTATTTGVFQKNANLVANDIRIGDTITINFDRDIDLNSLTSSNVKVKDLTTAGTPYIAYTLGNAAGGGTSRSITLTWTTALTAGNKYQIEINGLTTTAGNPVANEVIPFTANAAALTIAGLTTKDAGDNVLAGAKVYPNISGGFVTPAEVQTYKQGAGLVITFSTSLMASTVTTDNIYITKKNDTVKVPAEITYNAAQPTVVRLNPTANLEESTVYTLHVSKAVKTAAGLVLTDALTQDFSTYDLTAPQVLSVTGTDSVQAGVQNTITVAFNEAISIYDKSNNNAIINVSKASGATGAALANNNALEIHNVTTNANAAARLDSVALSTDAKSLIIKVTPTAAEVNTVFRITLNAKDTPTSTNAYFTDRFNTTTAAASANNSLAADYEIYFTTATDNVKPAVTKVVAKYDNNAAGAGNNVEIQGGLVSNIDITAGGTLVVDFSKNNIDGTTVTAANVKIHNVTTNTDTAATVVFDGNVAPGGKGRMTVTYGGALTPGNKYELRIGTGLKDTNNNAIAAVAFPFIAGQGPNVAATSPASLATLANNNANTAVGEPNSTTTTALDEPIFINFGVGSTAIDPNTLEGNVVLTKVGGSDVAITTSLGLATGGSFTSGAQYLKITPSANLEGSSSYRVTLRSGIKDINGNALAVASSGRGPEDYTFVFNTPDEVKPTVASIKSGSTELVGNEILNLKPVFTVTFSEPVARTGDAALVASGTPNLADDVLLYTATQYATPGVAPTTRVDVAGVASTRMGGKTNTYTTWTITPNSNLTAGDYVLVIKGDNTAGGSGVEDANGNPMAADYVYRFTATGTGQDLTAPAFVNVKPTDSSGTVINVVNGQGDILNADISAPLVLGFNEAINITGATVTVRDLSVSPVANVGILPLTRVDYNAASDNQGLRATFAATRLQDHIYEITVSGVKDIAGNTAADFTIYLTQK